MFPNSQIITVQDESVVKMPKSVLPLESNQTIFSTKDSEPVMTIHRPASQEANTVAKEDRTTHYDHLELGMGEIEQSQEASHNLEKKTEDSFANPGVQALEIMQNGSTSLEITQPEIDADILIPEKRLLHTTRQSSRAQDKEVPVLEKAIARKAGTKGTTSCSSKPSVNSSSSLDNIARVCGFSLGKEEATRLANISLIQAKEVALIALANAK